MDCRNLFCNINDAMQNNYNLGVGDAQIDTDDIEIIGEVKKNINTNASIAESKKEAGNVLYKQSKYYDALKMYTEALELCPDVAAYYGNRCACYIMLGKYQQALNDACKSVTLDDKFVKGYARKAKCHLALGQLESAEESLRKMLDLDKSISKNEFQREMELITKVRKYIFETEKYFHKNEFKLALIAVRHALEISPKCARYLLLKAECLVENGDYKEAFDIVSEILREDATNADALYIRGLTLYYQDQAEKALNHFQQAILYSPEHSKAKQAYKKVKLLLSKKEEGNAAYTNNKLDEAHNIYTIALTYDPKNKLMNAKLFFNRAIVSSKLKKFNDALDDCNNAIKLDPNYSKAILKRARLYMDLEMYEDAVREYQKLYQQERKPEMKTALNEAHIALKRSKRKDYYKILGVDKNANDHEIKKAYKKRAMLHHPDRHSDASEEVKKDQEKKFKELGEAYSVLSDAKKKSRYDNGLDLDECGGGGGSGFQDMETNIFSMFAGGGMPSGSGFHPGAFPGFTFQSSGYPDGHPFSAFFHR